MGVPVTTSYRNAQLASFRYPAHIQVSIEIVPPGAREGVTIATAANLTDTGYQRSAMVNSETSLVASVATFEQNRWSADGSQYLPSQVDSENFTHWLWASDTALPIELKFIFDKPYTFPGLSIVWDAETQSYPSDITIAGYTAGDLEIGEWNITDTDSWSAVYNTPLTNCSYIILTINAWNPSEWRPRIREVTFGINKVYNNNDIIEADSLQNIDPVSNALPQSHGSITFNNYNNVWDPLGSRGLASFLQFKQNVKLQWGLETASGTVEYLPAYTYWIDAIEAAGDGLSLTLKLASRYELLVQNVREDFWNDDGMYLSDLFQQTLELSDVIKKTPNETPWNIPPILAQYFTKAPIPDIPVNEALQLMANSIGHTLSIDPTQDYLTIIPLEQVSFESIGIDRKQTFGHPDIQLAPKLRSIQIGVTTYALTTNLSEVHRTENTLSGPTTLLLRYATDVVAKYDAASSSIVGGTMTVLDINSNSIRVQVIPTSPTTPVTITIMGYLYVVATTLYETYRDDIITEGIDIIVENPFITDTGFLEPLTAALRNVYNERFLYEVDYKGFPELTGGDAIYLESIYGLSSGHIYSNAIQFNGGFRGRLQGRAVQFNRPEDMDSIDRISGKFDASPVVPYIPQQTIRRRQ